MPRVYSPEKYKRYAQSERGRAARKRAHERYVEKRRAESQQEPRPDAGPLAQALSTWSRE